MVSRRLLNMKKYIYLAIPFLLVSCNGETSIFSSKESTPYQEETISLIPDEMKNYLVQEEQKKQFQALNDHYRYNQTSTYDYSKPVVISFEASNEGPYTISISDKEDFSSYYEISTVSSSYIIKDPIPGKTYYYEVLDNSNRFLKKGKIKIEKEKHLTVRYMNVEGTNNVRDLGGWNVSNGKEVQYGLIYRGARLNGDNCLTDKGLDMIRNTMGVKTELDLRNNEDDLGQTYAAFAEKSFDLYDRTYLKDDKFPYQMYDAIIKEASKPMNRKIFSYLADRNNYPFYIHCSAGADRTGTLCALINGVLGVSEDDLIRDYELTSFSKQGNRWRGASNIDQTDFDLSRYDTSGGVDARWGAFMDVVKAAGDKDDSLEMCFNKFLVNVIGVSQDDINSMKSIMLGLDRDVLSSKNIMETCVTPGHAVYKNGSETIEFDTKPLGHNFKKEGNGAFCLNCHELIEAKEDICDVKNGYRLDNDVIKALSVSNKEMSIVDNTLTFEKYMAAEEPTGFILTHKNGTLSYLDLTIYSLLISNEEDLFGMNKYTCDLIDIKGNLSTYGYFKLLNDINCSKTWTRDNSIGLNSTKGKDNSFKGFIDGNKKTISNFTASSLDGALIHSAGKETHVFDLTMKGSSLDSYWGSDFVTAYSYGGHYSNLTIEVSLGKGDERFNNTGLLGTIGYKENTIDVITLDNVSIINKGSTDIGYSSSIGQLYYDIDNRNFFQGLLKMNDVTIKGFSSSLVCFNVKENKTKIYSTYDEITALIGKDNATSLRVL